MGRAGFAYAQARMHARMADRMTAADWQFVEASRDLAHSLEAIRRVSPTERTQIPAHQRDVHAVERALHSDYLAQVDEATSWLPDRWHKALHWFANLPFLQSDEINSGEKWRRTWTGYFPTPKQVAPILAELSPMLARYLGPAAGAADRAALDWSQVEARLGQSFRKHAQTPAAAFAYLGLLALDHERLRGLLVTRVLFAEDG